MPLTILLCDDHTLVREGLAALLARQSGWQIIAQAGDGRDAVRLADEHQPDLALLDLAMPGMNGVDAAAEIRKRSPHTRIVALSMYGDEHYRRRMFGAGASAYVLKNDASAELVAAIRAVLRGEIYVSPNLPYRALAQPRRPAERDLENLTARERDVFCLLALGRRPGNIAATLGISVKTVESHRSRLMLKLGADNLADVIRLAVRAGIMRME